MFSRKMEWGTPIGFRFFMADRKIRALMFWLPSNLILPTLTLGPSFTTNVIPTAAGGICRTSDRMVKLVSVLREQAFDGYFRFLNAGRIILAFHRQADFRLLKAVEHVAGRDRAQAEVIYFADGWLFPYLEDDPPALGRLLPEDLDIFEVACVPQRVEVALQAGWVVDVPGMSKNARPNGIGGNTAVDLNVNFRDYVGLR